MRWLRCSYGMSLKDLQILLTAKPKRTEMHKNRIAVITICDSKSVYIWRLDLKFPYDTNKYWLTDIKTQSIINNAMLIYCATHNSLTIFAFRCELTSCILV